MTIRPYTPDDYGMIQAWREAHAGKDLPLAILPPLGCIAVDDSGPCAAIFCFECIGVGVAFIDCAVSRPGLSLEQASAAFDVLVPFVMDAAGQCWDPPGHYTFFRCTPLGACVRVLARMGFQRESERELVPMYLER